MNSGYIIRELRLTGPTVLPATITFRKGLNIISGPSNTGKTYIFQCINYMLGGSKPPKGIDEARNYAYCYLEIDTNTGKTYTLKSDLKGGNFHVYEAAIDTLTENAKFLHLDRTHSDSQEDNISQFFLSFCKLKFKKIKVNANGKKRGLSYRDLVKLILVDETKIITDKSLIITGQYVYETAEKRTFRLILTGNDDSDIIEKLSSKEITHRKGKMEMLTDLIAGVDKDILKLDIQNFDEEQLERTGAGISYLHQQLSSLDEINQDLNGKRNAYYRQLSEVSEMKDELETVHERSKILANQYDSDASRLLSTIEVSELLIAESTDANECPVCHSEITGNIYSPDVSAVADACKIEYTKIGLLKDELKASQTILLQEISEVNEALRSINKAIETLNQEIDEQVQQKINIAVINLEKLQKLNESLKHHYLLNERRKSLVDSKNLIAASLSKKKKENAEDNNLSSIIYPLTDQMQKILASCNYPNLTTVSFNEDKVDFIISGQDRELTGKGYRAITYSAFIIAIQKLLNEKKYSIGVPILDSPFVTYRKPEAGQEGITIDLAMDFYRYLAASELDQIIIMENEEPPSDIEAKVNHVIFTQSKEVGRYGFIPM